jgi:hypothetical protein
MDHFEELTVVPPIRLHHPDATRCPVLYVPGCIHKVKHVGVLVPADVVVIRHLAGGRHLLQRQQGGEGGERWGEMGRGGRRWL